MHLQELNSYHIILASQSPRRQFLLKELGINYTVQLKPVEETFPKGLKKEKIALYLSQLKAKVFAQQELDEKTIVITADTIVWINHEILGKPKDTDEAKQMLQLLSGNKHKVITAVTLKSKTKIHSFYVSTDVYFKSLTSEEIDFYVEDYKPYDKAGAYGIQEWIGYIGIEKIKGSFFNVMGLPIKELYENLIQFINK